MQMYDVEVTYLTMMGAMRCQFTTSARVSSREEADQLRDTLKALPALSSAAIKIKSAGLPTADEAMERILRSMQEYPPLR